MKLACITIDFERDLWSPDYDVELACNGYVKSSVPSQKEEFHFDVEYTKR